jgi:hypothetical protein
VACGKVRPVTGLETGCAKCTAQALAGRREMVRATERHEAGLAKVIPVIVRPCDWKDAPFGNLLAAPKDGKPITQWANVDEAFLDALAAAGAGSRLPTPL